MNVDAEIGVHGSYALSVAIFRLLFSMQQAGSRISLEGKCPQLKNAVTVFLEQVKWVSKYMFLEGSNDEHRLNEFKFQCLGRTSVPQFTHL